MGDNEEDNHDPLLQRVEELLEESAQTVEAVRTTREKLDGLPGPSEA